MFGGIPMFTVMAAVFVAAFFLYIGELDSRYPTWLGALTGLSVLAAFILFPYGILSLIGYAVLGLIGMALYGMLTERKPKDA